MNANKNYFQKCITLSLTFSICTSLQTHPIESPPYQSNSIYSQLTSDAVINLTIEEIFWLIAAVPSFSSGVGKAKFLIDEKKNLELQKCTHASQQTEDFIKTEIKKITKKHVDVVIHPQYSLDLPVASSSKNIIIAQYVADEIENALKTNDIDTLNKWKAVMQHEATHIAKNDVVWRVIAEMSLPWVIGASVRYLFNKIPQKTLFHKLLFAVDGGIIAYALTKMTRSLFCKYQEQRADNNIGNTRELLNGFKEFLKEIEARNRLAYASYTEKTYKLLRWLHNTEEDHPLHEIRVAKLDARIDTLERQNKTIKTIG